MRKKIEINLVSIYGVLGIFIGAFFGLVLMIYRFIKTPNSILPYPSVYVLTCVLSITLILLNYYLLKKRNWARISLLTVSAMIGLYPILIFISFLLKGLLPQEIIKVMSKGFKPLFVLYFLYFYSYIYVFSQPNIKKKFN
jgi:hypothetical protein